MLKLAHFFFDLRKPLGGGGGGGGLVGPSPPMVSLYFNIFTFQS
jgi:hypothetical protein